MTARATASAGRFSPFGPLGKWLPPSDCRIDLRIREAALAQGLARLLAKLDERAIKFLSGRGLAHNHGITWDRPRRASNFKLRHYQAFGLGSPLSRESGRGKLPPGDSPVTVT